MHLQTLRRQELKRARRIVLFFDVRHRAEGR
uniref:Uncharacterized protein n=1 Tax=Myoviridae sp. cte5Z19 TaxID=2825145 RepID=A0A8S5NVG3_9CAUD|nr:MAG TPA: hypothetical protein [Myoviridae sp. cte5Z19]